MKKVYVFILLFIPLISFAQVQIGQDIDGEAAGDRFGNSVSISCDGSIVAIGARNNNSNGDSSGQVRIYQNQENVWTQIGQNINGDSAGDNLGWSIKLSSDGSIIAIGVRGNNSNGDSSGQIRIYQNQENVWTQIGQNLNGEAENVLFGTSVDISTDGTIVAGGALFSQSDSSGSERVFEYQNSAWLQFGQDIDGEQIGDLSGGSISLSGDGLILAIGAHQNNENGIDAGHVRVFENLSGIWTQIGQDIDGEEGDFFGFNVALSSDGNILAIGAPETINQNEVDSGNVRVFENLNGIWTQIGQNINGEEQGDTFGFNIALSSDGNILAIGAPINSNNVEVSSGYVQVFTNQNGVWTQIGQDIIGEEQGDIFGFNVALSSDGNILAIGATQNNNQTDVNSGYVRIFDLSALLSIEENNQLQFELFPNPATDILNIQLQQDAVLEKVNIYNNIGQLVDTVDQLVIDASKLNSGIYFVEVVTTNGKASQKLIIE